MRTLSESKGDNLLSEKSPPSVAIILPAYNEQKEISSAISEMTKQTYAKREIIVVDDGSTDGTYDAALSKGNETGEIRVIRANHGGPSFARNLGVKESSGEIVFFGECDCVYDSDYVEKAVNALARNPKAGAVCLTGAPLILRSTLATDCIELENILQHKLLESGKIKPFYAWVFWRDAFNKAGGYDENLFQAEDRDLFNRIVNAGYEIAWVPGINWRHKRVESLSELSKKWFKRGRTRVLFSLKNRLLKDLAKAFAPFWFSVLGILLLFVSAIAGSLLILLVAALFIVQTARVARIAWPAVERKSVFLKYPVFLVARNFSTALGYSYGVLKFLARKLQGKKVSYKDV